MQKTMIPHFSSVAVFYGGVKNVSSAANGQQPEVNRLLGRISPDFPYFVAPPNAM